VLGDPRRTERLVRLAASAAMFPAGTVTAVVKESAEREGAFRLLENPAVESAAVAKASHLATVHRCKDEGFVYVPIDGSSLLLEDRARKRDVGQVGNWSQGGRGLQVVSALAVSPDGTPIGVCGQRWWARTAQVVRNRQRKRRPFFGQTEMQYTVDLLGEVYEHFTQQAPDVKPWFQLDRGYDAWAILQLAHQRKMAVTIRVKADRCVREHKKDAPTYLYPRMKKAPVLGHHHVNIPARTGRRARVAKLQIRACKLTIELRVSRKRREHVPMYVVSARELGRKKTPLHWTLMTTQPVESFQQALSIIDGYTTRWRIEEFHRAWKRGVCHVEDTQLRARESILKWATILGAVAARATRLTYLARESPDVPASEELTHWEIDAAIVLLRPKGINRGANPTLAQAVGWIAELGGFAGKYSGRPPGPTVIARGLLLVESFARGLKNLGEM
jgi:hypothetical protein